MNETTYIAHISEGDDRVQTVREHSINTATLCRSFAVPPVKELMYNIGLIHDIGKYQESFQRRINGDDITLK